MSTTPEPRQTRSSLARATGVMASGTLLSRVTGLLRTLATVYALGFGAVSGDYNLANTIPNMVTDLVLGGVLSATFVPVFVERLTSRLEDEAWEAISAVVSVTVVAIGVASLAFLAASPLIVRALTALQHGSATSADRRLATDLLVLFVPQLACYGFIALATAVLNARRHFAAPAFVPVLNNLVLVGVLVAFRQVVGPALVDRAHAAQVLLTHQDWILLLGVGTTAGVALQAMALTPALWRARLRVRWRPSPTHEAVRTVIRLSGWTFGLVVANQVALAVVLALSEAIGPRAVSAYSYGWQFFQLPYGVVAVSVMSATQPELAERWTRADLAGFRRRLVGGLSAVLTIILPAAAALAVMARTGIGVLAHLTHQGGSRDTALALGVLALGLPGFCAFQFAIRALQSVQDLRSAFWLYVLENAVNIVLALALYRPLGVEGIAASISAAYSVAALAALGRVRRLAGGIDGPTLGAALARALLLAGAVALGAAVGVNLLSGTTGPALLARLVLGILLAGAAVALGLGLGRLRGPGRPESRAPLPRPPRPGPRPGQAADPAPRGPEVLARVKVSGTAPTPPPPRRPPGPRQPPSSGRAPGAAPWQTAGPEPGE